jgi:hypothetical protein
VANDGRHDGRDKDEHAPARRQDGGPAGDPDAGVSKRPGGGAEQGEWRVVDHSDPQDHGQAERRLSGQGLDGPLGTTSVERQLRPKRKKETHKQ